MVNRRLSVIIAFVLAATCLFIFAVPFLEGRASEHHKAWLKLRGETIQLRFALKAYQASHGTLPSDLLELSNAGYTKVEIVSERSDFIPSGGWSRKRTTLAAPSIHHYGNESNDWVIWYSFPSTDLDARIREVEREDVATLAYDPTNGTASKGVIMYRNW